MWTPLDVVSYLVVTLTATFWFFVMIVWLWETMRDSWKEDLLDALSVLSVFMGVGLVAWAYLHFISRFGVMFG